MIRFGVRLVPAMPEPPRGYRLTTRVDRVDGDALNIVATVRPTWLERTLYRGDSAECSIRLEPGARPTPYTLDGLRRRAATQAIRVLRHGLRGRHRRVQR